MPERQSRHPDNDLIDRITDEKTPGQGGGAGGDLQRDIGKRAELEKLESNSSQPARVHKSDEDKRTPRPKKGHE